MDRYTKPVALGTGLFGAVTGFGVGVWTLLETSEAEGVSLVTVLASSYAILLAILGVAAARRFFKREGKAALASTPTGQTQDQLARLLPGVIEIMRREAQSIAAAAANMNYAEFAVAWEERYAPATVTALKLFDQLPVDSLGDARSLMLAVSIRNQFQMVQTAASAYARASAQLTSIRGGHGHDNAGLLRELLILRDQWRARIGSRQLSLGAIVGEFGAHFSGPA